MQGECLRAERDLAGAEPSPAVTIKDVQALVKDLGDIASALAGADPKLKPQLYEQLGIDVRYTPSDRMISACALCVSEGGLQPDSVSSDPVHLIVNTGRTSYLSSGHSVDRQRAEHRHSSRFHCARRSVSVHGGSGPWFGSAFEIDRSQLEQPDQLKSDGECPLPSYLQSAGLVVFQRTSGRWAVRTWIGLPTRHSTRRAMPCSEGSAIINLNWQGPRKIDAVPHDQVVVDSRNGPNVTVFRNHNPNTPGV